MKASFTSLCLFILLLILSCKKEEIKLNPKKAILGKWEITHTSFGPIKEPMVYEEYLPDGTLLVYNYKEAKLLEEKYWFTDSLIYKKRIYLDQNTNDTLLIDVKPYKYHFLDKNTLQLDFQFPAMNTLSVYKRID